MRKEVVKDVDFARYLRLARLYFDIGLCKKNDGLLRWCKSSMGLRLHMAEHVRMNTLRRVHGRSY